LIRALYQAGRNEEARSAEERYQALHGSGDSTSVPLARFIGLLRRGSCDEAGQILEELRVSLPAYAWNAIGGHYYETCDFLTDALNAYEKTWKENPLDSTMCNNLAWIYALTGRDLDRAEELANAAVTLSENPAASRNTLGAVLARKGDWAKAREMFLAARADDDRPSTQTVNDFFVALCDWKLGSRDEALASIRALLHARLEPDWRRRIDRSIALAEAGDDVTKAVFVDPEGSTEN
jgi:Flp pilus assembly protein TadD